MRKTALIPALLLSCAAVSPQLYSAFTDFEIEWTAQNNGNLRQIANWDPHTVPYIFQTGAFETPGPGVNQFNFFNPYISSHNTISPGEFDFESPNTFNVTIDDATIYFYTNGITNDSGTNQNFKVIDHGQLFFGSVSSADSTETGKVFIDVNQSKVTFGQASTASNANIHVDVASVYFTDSSKAGKANITLDDAFGSFSYASTPSAANFLAIDGSKIAFYNNNPESTPSIELQDGSNLNLFDKFNDFAYSSLQVRSLTGDDTTFVTFKQATAPYNPYNPYYALPNLIVNNFEDCTFAGSFAVTYIGPYDSPLLIKRGPATFTLSGNNLVFKDILIEEGTLNMASAQAFKADVLVRDKGILAGNGVILGKVLVYSGGTISPGNSIGEIDIAGPGLYLGSNGTYACEVNRAGQSDLIRVIGNVHLYGDLAVSDIDGRKLFTPYRIMSSNQNILGTFEHVTDTNPLVLDIVNYSDPKNIYLSFAPNLIAAAQSNNEAGVANQLDSITNPNADQLFILETLVNSSVRQAKLALDSFSGDQYTYLNQINRFGNERFNRRIYNAVRPTLFPCWCPDPCATAETWFQVEEGQSYAKKNHNGKGLRSLNWDLSLGVHAPIYHQFLVGAALNYQNDRLHFNQGGHTNWNTAQFAFYGAYNGECAYVFADGIFGHSWGKFKREIEFVGNHRRAKSRPKSDQALLYTELGLNFNWCNLLVQPFVAGEFGFYNQRKFEECGADALNLNVRRKIFNTTDSYLGAHFTTGWECITVSADVAWQHRFDRSAYEITAAFQEFGTDFTVEGVKFGKDGVKLALDISANITNSIRLYAEFSGEKWENWGAYGIDLGVGVWW